MPPKKGSKKRSSDSLGRSLIKAKSHPKQPDEAFMNRHVLDPLEDERAKTVSVVDSTDFSDLLHRAELEDRRFEAEKSSTLVLRTKIGFVERQKRLAVSELLQRKLFDVTLPIPHRPKWDRSMSRDELDFSERTAFLQWRRLLAKTEEQNKCVVSPFEKNLEVWRQLWRVVERSDVVCQITDARNPLLFVCRDLIQMAEESGKTSVVVLNKSDLLSEKQKEIWSKNLTSRGVPHLFFSAAAAATLPGGGGDLLDQLVKIGKAAKERKECKSASPEAEETSEKVVTIGFVGYPNVGKSSTINRLYGEKKTAVGPNPGKTKHFQTLWMREDVMLCDCPGLVFPTLLAERSELIVNGILPIHTVKDHFSPIELISSRFSSSIFERLYSLRLSSSSSPSISSGVRQVVAAEELLTKLAASRGFMGSKVDLMSLDRRE